VGQHLHAALDRFERDPAISLKELARPGLQPGIVEPLIIEMAVHAVEPRGDPTAAGLEKSDTELWMPLANSAPDHTHAGKHHLHRVRDDVLRAAALKAVDPDRRHIEARAFVNPDRHVELFRGAPEGLVIGVVKHSIVVWIRPDKARPHAEFLAPKVQLLD